MNVGVSSTNNKPSNIIVNLRGNYRWFNFLECWYDIFRKVAQDLFGWDTLLPGDASVITGKRRLPPPAATTTTAAIEEDAGGSTTQVDAPSAASNLLIMRGLPDKGRWDDAPWDINWFDNGGLTPEWFSTLLPW
jgi:hypothetical protein